MRKSCVKTVEIVWKACAYEHILCTKSTPSNNALWVTTRLLHGPFRRLNTWFTTPIFYKFSLLKVSFSPLSTGLITKATFLNKLHCY